MCDAVPLSQQPQYNEKRRSRMVGATMPRLHSYPETTLPKRASNHIPALSIDMFAPPGEYLATHSRFV